MPHYTNYSVTTNFHHFVDNTSQGIYISHYFTIFFIFTIVVYIFRIKYLILVYNHSISTFKNEKLDEGFYFCTNFDNVIQDIYIF